MSVAGAFCRTSPQVDGLSEPTWDKSAYVGRRVPTSTRLMLSLLVCACMNPHAVVLAQEHKVSHEQFDSWVFQQQGNAELAQHHLQTRLELQIQKIDRAHRLSEAQKQRLRLAGRGDIHRFFNRLVVAHKKLDDMEHDQEIFQMAHQMAVGLQRELAFGIFGESSLFEKILGTTLSDSQMELHREHERAGRRQKYNAFGRLSISNLEMSIPLTAAQREAMVQVAVDEIERRAPDLNQLMLMMQHNLLPLPEERIEKILDANQLEAIREINTQREAIEQMLQQQGVLGDGG